jgi:quinol monooxygenase YgiN
MSVLIVSKMSGDVAAFRKALNERPDEFTAWAEKGRAAGAIHHQFGVGDGYVVVVDEWESVEQFEAFFGDPELQAFIGSAGGDPNSQPELTVGEAIASPDKF